MLPIVNRKTTSLTVDIEQGNVLLMCLVFIVIKGRLTKTKDITVVQNHVLLLITIMIKDNIICCENSNIILHQYTSVYCTSILQYNLTYSCQATRSDDYSSLK